MSNIIKVILALSFTFGIVLIILGFKHGGDIKDFSLNFGTELLGIFITVLAIEYIYRREERKATQQEEKKRLIGILATGSRESAEEVLDELRVKMWLHDGSIEGLYFDNRDFRGFDFVAAKFVNCWFNDVTFDEANLRYVSFKGVSITGSISFKNTDMFSIKFEGFSASGGLLLSVEAQDFLLFNAKRLRFAIMPDGKRYDGRYNCTGDIDDAARSEIPLDPTHHDLPETAEKMAVFYNVSLEEYLAGQEWAKNNLAYYVD